jgi:hypothetical protein
MRRSTSSEAGAKGASSSPLGERRSRKRGLSKGSESSGTWEPEDSGTGVLGLPRTWVLETLGPEPAFVRLTFGEGERPSHCWAQRRASSGESPLAAWIRVRRFPFRGSGAEGLWSIQRPFLRSTARLSPRSPWTEPARHSSPTRRAPGRSSGTSSSTRARRRSWRSLTAHLPGRGRRPANRDCSGRGERTGRNV